MTPRKSVRDLAPGDELDTEHIAELKENGRPMLGSESWSQFRDHSPAEVPMLVDGLIPEGALGFLAAPPKAGKTWLALGLALSVATGEAFLGHFQIPRRRPVLYLALEGARAAVRARTAALARGLGIDPDGAELDEWFRIAYKPPGIDISDVGWTVRITAEADRLDAGLVVVDVLRAAAPRLPESGEGATHFAAIRQNLAPVTDAGRVLLLLHHFVKTTESTQDRSLGDRMSGSGALFGAADVLMAITATEEKGRRMRLEAVGRDIIELDPLGIDLEGAGSGEHGGITHADTVNLVATNEAPDTTSGITKARHEEIAEFVRSQPDQRATPVAIREAFSISEKTLKDRRSGLRDHQIHYLGEGRGAEYAFIDPGPRHTPESGVRGPTRTSTPDPGPPIRGQGSGQGSDGSIDETNLDLLDEVLLLASQHGWPPISRHDEPLIRGGETGWSEYAGRVRAGDADAIRVLPQLRRKLEVVS